MKSADDIPSWTHQQIKPSSVRCELHEITTQYNIKLCEKVGIWNGDISSLQVDAIVNSTTDTYLGKFGVDAAIHSAAGPELRKECGALRACKVGEVKITRGYKLAAKNVIHTVAPVDRCNVLGLIACYDNALELMLTNDLKTIAIPCVSTGGRGFPKEIAANVALLTVRKFLEQHYCKVSKIILCTYRMEDYNIYDRLMWGYFPIHQCRAAPKIKLE